MAINLKNYNDWCKSKIVFKNQGLTFPSNLDKIGKESA